MNTIKKLASTLLLLVTFFAVAQAQKISGRVIDAATSKPIASASIQTKNTNKGAQTNESGTFTIVANAGDVLIISAIGFNTTEVIAKDNIIIELTPKVYNDAEVVVVGTRGAARAKTETAVPIDVIKINQVGAPTAKMDLTSVLNMAAPSFNYNKQSGSDGADHVDLGTLRGLAPDQTLVLINGKRRHTTALVGLFGTRGKGSTGTDLNAFPQSAVDRIEILRDGASAQYGSDAIAGVINIILKKDINHWNVNVGLAGYHDTKFNANKFNQGNQYVSGKNIDGQQFSLAATNGFSVGNNGGFASFAIEALVQGKTFRQADTSNWKSNKNSLPYLGTGRRAFGDGSLNSYGASYNMELPIKNSQSTFYSFATVKTRESDAFAYSRNYSAKPERFPTTSGGALIFVPSIMQIANDGEIYYNPHIGTNINDASIALGLKGKSVHDWNWDASVTTGKNDFQFNGSGTFNASDIGNTTKNNFEDGGFRFRQVTSNLDFSKSFKKVANGLNIGYGFEYRNEKYTINKGEEKSYNGYYSGAFIFPILFGNGSNPPDSLRSMAVGSQGFPGYSPNDTITATRNNFSVYLDGELNITNKWLINAAVRAENYSDFGSVATYKFATRYKATDKLNLRGSFSTGFKAPSLQQINFSNTLTSFSGGQLIQTRIARNGDAISNAAGIPKLKEETSLNTSVGFAWKPMKGLTITTDGYMIKVKDRVVVSGAFYGGDPSLPASFNSLLSTNNIDAAQFLTNAVNTTNIGLDIVADYTKKWSDKTLKVLLAGNFQKVKVDKINIPTGLASNVYNQKVFYSDREESLLKASAPASKFSLSGQYNCKKLGYGATITSFGAIKILGFGSPTTQNPYYGGIDPQVTDDATGNLIPEIANYKLKISTDVFVSYKYSKKVSLFIGADNVFNAHPNFSADVNAKQGANGNETGGPWDAVQMGYNGRKLFTRLVFNF
jgi:iron complex outermembrane recepter protein